MATETKPSLPPQAPKLIRVRAVANGVLGVGKEAHRVRMGTEFDVEEGFTGSWVVPVDPKVKLALPAKKLERQQINASRYEAEVAMQEKSKKGAPVTLGQMARGS